MSDHGRAVYNNSCLSVPRHPLNQQPYPVYEQEYFIKNPRKYVLDIKNMDMKMRNSYPLDSQKVLIKSLLEFYDSIPEYDDVNHLPNREFYKKLENLREKQRLFCKYLHNGIKYENKKTEWANDYKDLAVGEKKIVQNGTKRPKSSLKPFCATPSGVGKLLKNSDIESVSSLEKDIGQHIPPRRSVKIEDEKSSPTVEDLDDIPSKIKSPSSSKLRNRSRMEYYLDDLSINDYKSDSCKELLTTRSEPNSPIRSKPTVAWKDNGVTIPEPFQMTVRDEKNRIIDEVLATEIKEKPSSGRKSEMFRAHSIPIESRIPLFDKIMAEQERRREKVKSKSKQALMAKMRPFSFTRREEEVKELGKYFLSRSSPSIFSSDKPKKHKPFKAKPVPKNLFSNYIYKKMSEDEFYRALKKRIRAEEMLKASSLPPSMAKREKYKPKLDICPKTLKSLQCLTDSDICRKCLHFIPHHKKECLDKELEELTLEFSESTPSSKSSKKKSKRNNRKVNRSITSSSRNTSAQSYSSDSLRAKSAADLQSINHSNLAAVLRIQSAKKVSQKMLLTLTFLIAKKRMEEEMARRLEEAKLREEIRWREKALRQKPVWQNLAYNHEEDLAVRLQLRKDEERMRNEEHRHRMELMYGRVNDMPTLFERQSQFTKNTKPKQHCLTRYERNFNKTLERRCSSRLSDVWERDKHMVDEAVQAKLEDSSEERNSSSSKEVEEVDEESKSDGNGEKGEAKVG